MSTRDSGSPLHRRVATLLFALALLPTAVLFLRRYAPGDMWLGCLVGGLVTLLLLGVAAHRARRSPQTVTTAERIVASHGDERDRTVRNRALASLGVAAIPLTSVAAVAVAVGTPAAATLTLLLWTLLAVVVTAFLRADRAL
jgi:hypothetical protein